MGLEYVTDVGSPSPGSEWKPIIEAITEPRELSGEEKKAFEGALGDLNEWVRSSVKRSEKAVEFGEGVIEDPLAYYVPYHSPPSACGIYFRINKMLDDFKEFAYKAVSHREVRSRFDKWIHPLLNYYRRDDAIYHYYHYIRIIHNLCREYRLLPSRVERILAKQCHEYLEEPPHPLDIEWPLYANETMLLLWDLWRIYVEVVYVHELTHHILEDIIEYKYKKAKRAVLNRSDEEGFCEYVAFGASEGTVYPSCVMYYVMYYIPYIPPLIVPLYIPIVPPELRALYGFLGFYISFIPSSWLQYWKYAKTVLSILYYHWGRDKDPVYRPIVRQSIVNHVKDVWEYFWSAHMRCDFVIPIEDKDEIYTRLYVTYQ